MHGSLLFLLIRVVAYHKNGKEEKYTEGAEGRHRDHREKQKPDSPCLLSASSVSSALRI
ncbi:protein of unknown function [Candidatus Promineifilum breve]|uniref:Uncharacterized protein n=1 Tax=Candidatus Promineifilum breve TaxID=1806508 RepID=A0A160T862_9CHLR|nr:protein of unknown function [Candidatus Promineifilum breve]